MSDIRVAISLIESESRDKVAAANTAEDKLKAAFSVAKNHWMFTDEDTQLRAGIGAVMTNLGIEHPDYIRLENEVRMLRNITAMLSGVPVNLETAFPEDEHNPIGVMKIWREV